MSITYSACVSVVLGIQHAKRIRRIALSPVGCQTKQYFPHYQINGTIFEKNKKVIDHKMCVFIFSTNFV